MKMIASFLGLCACLAIASAACAEDHRSRAALDAFQHTHPCPSTGLTHPLCMRGINGHRYCHRCPGYVIDHIISLYCGGPDEPSNMNWQTIRDAKDKDKWENKTCHRMR